MVKRGHYIVPKTVWKIIDLYEYLIIIISDVNTHNNWYYYIYLL